MHDYLRLIRNFNFTKLWGSQILSQVAQNLLYFALIIRVFELASHTKFANISVAMVVLAFGLPAIFFGVIAGTYVDGWNRKWVMVFSNLVRAGLVLLFPLVESNLAAVLILSFVFASVSQFFVPAEAAAIPSLVKRSCLTAANSLFIFSMYGAFIVGYGSSAAALNVLGDHGPYMLAAVMLFTAAVLDLLLPSLRSPGRQAAVHLRSQARGVLGRIRANLRVIRGKRELYFPIALLAITQSVVGIILALAPALSQALLHKPLTDVSHILLVPAGVGMILGVVLVSHLVKVLTPTRIVARSFVIASVALTLLGMSGLLYRSIGGETIATVWQLNLIVALLVFTLGLLNAVISVTAQTMLHEHSDEKTRGNVFGVLNTTVNVAATLPVFAAGILSDVFSVTKVVFIVGIVLTCYSLYQLGAVSRDPEA